jgi:hypothetical protein
LHECAATSPQAWQAAVDTVEDDEVVEVFFPLSCPSSQATRCCSRNIFLRVVRAALRRCRLLRICSLMILFFMRSYRWAFVCLTMQSDQLTLRGWIPINLVLYMLQCEGGANVEPPGRLGTAHPHEFDCGGVESE